MPVIDSAKRILRRARERIPLFDHLIRMVQHYGAVKGNSQAGAVTYFGFLSFFPIMALAFFAVGQVSLIYPDAEQQLIVAISGVLPDLVTEDGRNGTIALADIQAAAGAAAGIGLVGVLYSGMNWLSGLREALLVVFELPHHQQPNFVVGKLKDLVSLTLIGVTLIVSVAVAGLVTGLSDIILGWFGLSDDLKPLLALLSVAVGLAANMVLFYFIFRVLADSRLPGRSLWSGALIGAIGFEALKYLAATLIGLTRAQPAFQAFGIALILLVWINYFSRVVMYAASWAYTSPAARAHKVTEAELSGRAHGPSVGPALARAQRRRSHGPAFAAGAASMVGLAAVARRLAPPK